MKKSMKKILTMGLTASLAVTAAFPAFAGQWAQEDGGSSRWWYEEDDGSYPADQWKELDSVWYHFDANGYMDVGWKYINSRWYFMNEDGAMETENEYEGGYLNVNGAWVSRPAPPENLGVCSEEEKEYWEEKQEKYGLSGDLFVENEDGTYTLTYTYDPATVLPDLSNAIFSTAAFRFNGFSYSWYTAGGVFTFHVTDVVDTY